MVSQSISIPPLIDTWLILVSSFSVPNLHTIGYENANFSESGLELKIHAAPAVRLDFAPLHTVRGSFTAVGDISWYAFLTQASDQDCSNVSSG